jgi:hypothetical protein
MYYMIMTFCQVCHHSILSGDVIMCIAMWTDVFEWFRAEFPKFLCTVDHLLCEFSLVSYVNIKYFKNFK